MAAFWTLTNHKTLLAFDWYSIIAPQTARL